MSKEPIVRTVTGTWLDADRQMQWSGKDHHTAHSLSQDRVQYQQDYFLQALIFYFIKKKKKKTTLPRRIKLYFLIDFLL